MERALSFTPDQPAYRAMRRCVKDLRSAMFRARGSKRAASSKPPAVSTGQVSWRGPSGPWERRRPAYAHLRPAAWPESLWLAFSGAGNSGASASRSRARRSCRGPRPRPWSKRCCDIVGKAAGSAIPGGSSTSVRKRLHRGGAVDGAAARHGARRRPIRRGPDDRPRECTPSRGRRSRAPCRRRLGRARSLPPSTSWSRTPLMWRPGISQGSPPRCAITTLASLSTEARTGSTAIAPSDAIFPACWVVPGAFSSKSAPGSKTPPGPCSKPLVLRTFLPS